MFEGRDALGSAFAGPCGYNLQQMLSYFSPGEVTSGFGVIFCISLFIYKDGAKIAQVWGKSLKNGVCSLFQVPFQPFNAKFSFQLFSLLCKCHILRALLEAAEPLYLSAALGFSGLSAPF